jgi:hypothetical protein
MSGAMASSGATQRLRWGGGSNRGSNRVVAIKSAAKSDAVGPQQFEGEAALQSAHAAKEEAQLVLKARGNQHESVLEAQAVEHAAQLEQIKKEADRAAEIEARAAKADQGAAVAELVCGLVWRSGVVLVSG